MAEFGSTIGNYIHYNYLNYLTHGLSVDGNSPIDVSSIIAEQHAAITAQIRAQIGSGLSEGQIQELEYYLNFFRPKSGESLKNNDITQQEKDQVEQALTAAIERNLSKYLNDAGGITNWTTMNAYSTKRGGKGQMTGTNNTELANDPNNNNGNRIGSIQERINNLINTINNVYNGPNKGELWAKINQLKLDWEAVLKELELDAVTDANRYVKGLRGSEGISGRLNSLLNEFKSKTLSWIKGEMAEQYAVAAAQIAAEWCSNKTTTTLNELLNQIFDFGGSSFGGNQKVGNQLSAYGLNKDYFGVTGRSNSVDHFSAQGLFTNFSMGEAKLNYTQDKVDVKIQLDGINVNGSVKNYNLFASKEITLHTGRSILALIQEYGTFVNHYLNVTAMPTGGPSSISEGIDRPIHDMNNLLMLTLATKALAGGIYGVVKSTGIAGFNETAQVFNVNGNDGLFKVYSISKI